MFQVEGKKFHDHCAVRIMRGSIFHVSTYDTDDPVKLNEHTIYIVVLNNEGITAKTGVVMIDDIPKEMEFVKAEGPGDYSYDKKSHQVKFAGIPILQPGEKLTYKIVCRAIREGSAKNTVRAYFNEFSKAIIDEEGTSVYK